MRWKSATQDVPVFVYCIKCAVNGKMYIGLTNNITRRWRDHKRVAMSKTAKNRSAISDAIKKYGFDAFTMTVMYEAINLREAVAVERGLIAQYGTMDWAVGYNRTVGGEYLPGGALSLRSKKILSDMNRGRPVDEAYKARRLAKNGGTWHTPETIEKIKAKKNGCKLPPAYLAERRARNGGKWHPSSQPEKLRALWATPEFRAKQTAARPMAAEKRLRKVEARLYGPSVASIRAMARTLPTDYYPRGVAL